MGCRECPVSSLNHGFESVILQKGRHFLWRQVVECRTQQACSWMDMGCKFLPWLDIAEIASALACYHYFSTRSRHFLYHCHPAAIHRGSCGSHKPGGASSDYYYLAVFHLFFIKTMQIWKKLLYLQSLYGDKAASLA